MNSEKKLHILFLSSWYPSRVFQTHGNFVQKHAQAIALKQQVTVVYPIGDATKKTNAIEISDTSQHNVREIIIYFKKHKFAPINARRKYKALEKGLLLVSNFDIIHANVLFPIGILAVKVKKKYKVPLVFTEHWTGYMQEDQTKISLFKKIVLRKIVKESTFIVPVSKTLKKAMLNFGLKGNYCIIGNSVDTELFIPKKKDTSIFRILHISYLNNNQKNIKGLLETILKLSKKRTNFIVDIIGDGNHNQTLLYIKELNIPKCNLKLHNAKTPQKIAQFMQQSNVYVSFSNYETFGIVMIESLATKTPVISTKTGILTEYDTTDFCNLIDIGNQEQLLYHLNKHMDGECTFDTIKMRDFVTSNFSCDHIAQQYSKVYYNSLSKKY